MRSASWGSTEGFIIGAGLLLVGAVLHLVVGPFEWSWLAFPHNIVILAVYFAFLAAAYLLRKKMQVFEWMMHSKAAVPAVTMCVAVTLVMGITGWDLLGFWPFLLIYAWIVTIIGLACINRAVHFNKRSIPFLLNHLGLFVALAAGFLGRGDLLKCEMVTFTGIPQEYSFNHETGDFVKMPFVLTLDKFEVEYHDGDETSSRMPKRFASDVTVSLENAPVLKGCIEVNKPLKVKGWQVYQAGYEQNVQLNFGQFADKSVFSLVRDPWLPAVYCGILLLLAGALCTFITETTRKR